MDYKDTITASDFVVENMTEFARYNTTHKFGSYIDGLKLIHRRILWTLRDTVKDIKVLSASGEILKLHPHGDSSTVEAIFRLTQDHKNVLPLLGSVGYNGAYSTGTHAAARYVETCITEFARDLYFKHTNLGTLRMIRSEVENDKYEPEYLIPCLPAALLTGTYGIGLGYRCHVIPMGLSEVCDATIKYVSLLRDRKDPKKYMKQFAKYFIADFPVDSHILNRNQLLTDYSNGNFDTDIITEGTMTLTPNAIFIHTLPQEKLFHLLHDKLGSMIIGKDNFIANTFSRIDNLSTGKKIGNLKLTLRRGIDPFTILDKLKAFIGFTASWTPLMYFSSSEGTLAKLTPFDLISLWYRERARSIQSELKYTQTRYVNELRMIAALVAIVDHTREVTEIFEKAVSQADTVATLRQRFNLTDFQANYIGDLKMSQITKTGKAALLAKKEEITAKLMALKQRFMDIPSAVIADAKYMKETYGKLAQRRTIFPEYKGAVITSSGIIQCEDLEAIKSNLASFPDADFIYQADSKYRYCCKNNAISCINDQPNDLPRETGMDRYILSEVPLTHTVCRRSGTISRVEGLQYKADPDMDLFYTTKKSIYVTKAGIVGVINTEDFVLRKSIVATGVASDVIYVAPYRTKRFYVVYVNIKEPNVVRIDKITESGRLKCLPNGKSQIIGIYSPDDTVSFSVPQTILSRCPIRHFFIDDIEKALQNETSIRLYLSKKITSNGVKLTSYKKSILWTL